LHECWQIGSSGFCFFVNPWANSGVVESMLLFPFFCHKNDYNNRRSLLSNLIFLSCLTLLYYGAVFCRILGRIEMFLPLNQWRKKGEWTHPLVIDRMCPCHFWWCQYEDIGQHRKTYGIYYRRQESSWSLEIRNQMKVIDKCHVWEKINTLENCCATIYSNSFRSIWFYEMCFRHRTSPIVLDIAFLVHKTGLSRYQILWRVARKPSDWYGTPEVRFPADNNNFWKSNNFRKGLQ